MTGLACCRGWTGDVLETARTYSVAYVVCQSRPPACAASSGACMAWRTEALCVVAGEPERRGNATFVCGPRSRAPNSTCGPHLSWRRKLLVGTSGRRRRLLV
jgi:hypothetical protein